MERSSNNDSLAAQPGPESRPWSILHVIDTLTLAGMAIGIGLIIQPWWAGGLRAGFFVTAFATLAQIIVGHLSDE